MTQNAQTLLTVLEKLFNAKLDKLHDDLIAKFRTLARSTGQRTRVRP